MTTFIRITDGQPEKVSLAQLRQENPNTSFPKEFPVKLLRDMGLFVLEDAPRPTPANRHLEVVEDQGYEPVPGKRAYRPAYAVCPSTAAEQKAAEDKEFDSLFSTPAGEALHQWLDTMIPDFDATYRAALRRHMGLPEEAAA